MAYGSWPMTLTETIAAPPTTRGTSTLASCCLTIIVIINFSLSEHHCASLYLPLYNWFTCIVSLNPHNNPMGSTYYNHQLYRCENWGLERLRDCQVLQQGSGQARSLTQHFAAPESVILSSVLPLFPFFDLSVDPVRTGQGLSGDTLKMWGLWPKIEQWWASNIPTSLYPVTEQWTVDEMQ